jgi:hypothetical protein
VVEKCLCEWWMEALRVFWGSCDHSDALRLASLIPRGVAVHFPD